MPARAIAAPRSGAPSPAVRHPQPDFDPGAPPPVPVLVLDVAPPVPDAVPPMPVLLVLDVAPPVPDAVPPVPLLLLDAAPPVPDAVPPVPLLLLDAAPPVPDELVELLDAPVPASACCAHIPFVHW